MVEGEILELLPLGMCHRLVNRQWQRPGVIKSTKWIAKGWRAFRIPPLEDHLSQTWNWTTESAGRLLNLLIYI